MDKKIKALFFDIDGTLVSFKTHRIPQSTVDALEQAKKNGVEVYISTGRPKQIINNLGQIEHLIDGYITANGARCFVEDTLVSQQAILPSDVKKIIEAADRDNYPAIVVSESYFAIHHYTDEVYEIFCKGLGVDSSVFVTDINSLGDEAILQVTPFCTVEQEALLMPTLENCTSGRWHPAFTDITARGADKGKGLQAMADYLGLNIEETMAFGDGGNDISIIKEAGVGVAMGNAGEEPTFITNLCSEIPGLDNHGMSGNLSAAIAVFCAKGQPLDEAVRNASVWMANLFAENRPLTGRGNELLNEFVNEIAEHFASHNDVRFYADRLNVSSTYLAQVTRIR